MKLDIFVKLKHYTVVLSIFIKYCVRDLLCGVNN